MSDKIKDTEEMNENKEITAEDLDGVAGGRIRYYMPMLESSTVCKYGGPDMYRPRKPLTPEEQKKLEEERKNKEQEQKKALEKNIENPEIN